MDHNLILHLDSNEPGVFRLVARNAPIIDGLHNENFELIIVYSRKYYNWP